ncbi:MAG: hypothetical protein Q8P41_20140 [Pseudomonadota bacterium]|nr:hypothetical protein [Pseudomonadota bacterium]
MIAFFLLAACITESSFPGNVAATSCSREQECHKSDFEDNYSDYQDCYDDQSEALEDAADCYNEYCDFDAEAASDYIGDFRSADCEDVNEAAGDVGGVWDHCEDDWALLGCLTGFR